METTALYETYKRKMQQVADLRNASAVLQWDQETYLPAGGAQFRGQQISTLSEISHRMFCEDAFGDLLKELLEKNGLQDQERINVERTWEDYTRNRKYSSEFVRKLSEQVNKAFHAWLESRKQNSFGVYEKELDALVALKRQEAELLGYAAHPYNALLDEFEKGATVSMLDKLFEHLLPSLQSLYRQIAAQPQAAESFLQQHFPKDKQWEWGLYLLKQLNFDFDKGRQDLSEHPFSVSFNPHDVRITTRVSENDFANMTWSCIHEAGHALYEQGLPENQYGLPLGEACSYSIHESQSRLWENSVGRGRSFWKFYYPVLQQYFPDQLSTVDLGKFYRGINKVQPSLIRTEADEITYHFHVYIRYELEKKLIEASLNTRDIPAFWNDQYKQLLDMEVPDDKQGCLQDVHWSHGSFGYFPTYSLGSFYAAQFYSKAEKDIPALDAALSSGNNLPLLSWLRDRIHAKGRYFKSEDLCRDVTGETLNVGYFIDYLTKKYKELYKL